MSELKLDIAHSALPFPVLTVEKRCVNKTAIVLTIGPR
jgi:hypothetical protein